MRIGKTLAALGGSLLVGLFGIGCDMTAFAEVSLPQGAVKGLPERLAALDDEGKSVNSESGEYFFIVENMEFGVTYSKSIELISLRDSGTYDLYMNVEPLTKSGDIDLEKGCECVFLLDGKELYRGDVYGSGNIDLTQQALECGSYAPGDQHTLRCDITWNKFDVDINVDKGKRVYDKDGEHIVREGDEDAKLNGEIEFKWIFSAALKETEDSLDDHDESRDGGTYTPNDPEYNGKGGKGSRDRGGKHDIVSTDSSHEADGSEGSSPDGGGSGNGNGNGNGDGSSSRGEGFFPPYTGFLLKSGSFWLVCMGAIGVMTIVMLVLIFRQKKKNTKKGSGR